MKILITNTGPWGTGSFTVARAIMEEFIDMGHEVKLFFPDEKLPSSELDYFYSHEDLFIIWRFPIHGAEVVLSSFPLMIPDPHPRNSVGRTFAELSEEELSLYLKDFRIHITKVIEEFQPDVIECQHIWALDHVIKEFGKPFACVAHHSDQLGFRFDQRMQSLAIDSAKKANYIFAVSKYVKEEVISLYGVEEEKVIVLTNGYNRKIFHPMQIQREEVIREFDLDIPKDAFIVNFAGKLSKTKGVDILLLANKLLDPKWNIHFILLGSGDIRKALDPNLRNEYSFERVHFLGHQPTEVLPKIHNISNIHVMPSRSEGFGIACLEAMGCGLPAIVTKSGGPEDFAVGRLIEKEDPQGLANAILELRTLPPEKMTDLKQKALKKAQEFSWRSIAQSRLDYYNKMITTPSS